MRINWMSSILCYTLLHTHTLLMKRVENETTVHSSWWWRALLLFYHDETFITVRFCMRAFSHLTASLDPHIKLFAMNTSCISQGDLLTLSRFVEDMKFWYRRRPVVPIVVSQSGCAHHSVMSHYLFIAMGWQWTHCKQHWNITTRS